MFRNDFYNINENVVRSHCSTNSQFLKRIMYEEDKIKAVRAQEILMTFENPMIKEQKESVQICSELKKLEREKFLEENRKALLHQNESDVRELVAQIKQAHIKRQLLELKALNEQKIKEQLQARLVEKERFNEECKRNKELALEEERENVQKKAAFRQDLLKQMQEKDKERELERELIAKERENRKKLIISIQQDIEKEKQYVLKLKEMLRQDKEEYLQKVELYKRQKEADAQEDHRKEMELIRQRDEEKRLRAEKRKQVMQERAAVSERIGQQVLILQMEKQKHNEFLLELLIGERLAKDDERHKLNMEKQIQRAKSLENDFQRTFLARQQEELFRRDREKNMAEEQMKIFLDLESKDKDIKSLKLTKNKEYCQDLLNAIECKNLERKFEASQNKIKHEQLLEMQKKRVQEIEAEKLSLLRKEPLENLKFLPIKAISAEHRSLLGLTCKDTKEQV